MAAVLPQTFISRVDSLLMPPPPTHLKLQFTNKVLKITEIVINRTLELRTLITDMYSTYDDVSREFGIPAPERWDYGNILVFQSLPN